MLIHEFFLIRKWRGGDNDNECVYRLSLNAEHPIYQAHFQGNPIMPGACIIQIMKELAEDLYSTSYFIRCAKNVKFLNVINPLKHKEIDVRLSFRKDENNMLAVSAVIDWETTVFSKLSLVLEEKHNAKKTEFKSRMNKLRLCVVIPTYNNEKTIARLVKDVLKFTDSVVVVNDGSTDRTNEILESFTYTIELVSYKKNKGKGHALIQGFDRADEMGCNAAITIDADGQHFAKDIEEFVRVAEQYPDTLLVGQRIVEGRIPSGNNFANKFSNFWFMVQTGRYLRDTQNGFRLYPLAAMDGMRPFSSRYEAELELLVRAAWKGISIRPVPVNVYYPPKEERVSHFRPWIDFLRISLLNTCLVFLAVVYGYPSMVWYKLFKKS